MEMAMLDRHIALARRHVELGERQIARQRAIIEHLRQQAHDTGLAERLLDTFETLQELHRRDLRHHLQMRADCGA
jgi:hypothetical protein